MQRSAVPATLVRLRIAGVGGLAALAGFAVVAGFLAGLLGLETAGPGVLLGWIPTLGGVGVAVAFLWAGDRLLPSSRPWYLAAWGAFGAMLAVMSPLLVYVSVWWVVGAP